MDRDHRFMQRKQAIPIALSLPQEDETKIREKVLYQLPLEDLNRDNRMSILFLDKHLSKDDLTDCFDMFESNLIIMKEKKSKAFKNI